MTRRLVYAIRPLKNVKGAYEAKVEYMPGYVKSFIGKDMGWIVAEVQKALDNKVPNLGGPEKVEGETHDG